MGDDAGGAADAGAPLLSVDRELVAGTVRERPNRFVLRVAFGDAVERVHLADPGALAAVESGATVVCAPATDPERATGWDAVAVDAGGTWVSLRAALANDLFAATVERDLLAPFAGAEVVEREPPLPDGEGRADFVLARDGGEHLVEVKSATHVAAGVAKFPDRQTARGRRHLRSLRSAQGGDRDCHVVFVVQRGDADVLRPFREVDPEFADLLAAAREDGVGVHAVAVRFDPPTYRLADAALPVEC